MSHGVPFLVISYVFSTLTYCPVFGVQLKLDYISSSGLQVLLMPLKTVSNKGGKLVLFGMQEAVFEVFKICRFDSLFTITKDKAAALQAVAS